MQVMLKTRGSRAPLIRMCLLRLLPQQGESPVRSPSLQNLGIVHGCRKERYKVLVNSVLPLQLIPRQPRFLQGQAMGVVEQVLDTGLIALDPLTTICNNF